MGRDQKVPHSHQTQDTRLMDQLLLHDMLVRSHATVTPGWGHSLALWEL